ncbi:MAG: nucleotide exchange factor GrpE [Angelakisella sp.]
MAPKKDKTAEEKLKDNKTAEQSTPDTTGAAEAAPAEEKPQQPPEPTAEEKLAAQLKEAEDRNLRLMAEFDNFRRRTMKEKETIYPDAVANTVKELLPVLDNFQRALEAPCQDEEYRKGVEMTYKGLSETLEKMGLTQFAEAGETFDPNLHNAVMHIEDDALAKGVISQVFQRGYKIGDNVLRYAMVQTAN